MSDEAPIAAPVHRSSFIVPRLVQALWFGAALFFLAVAAPAAFSASSTPVEAANVVGTMLTRWHYIALFAPLILLLFEWRRSRPMILILLFIAVLVASAQALVDTRIRVMRMTSPTPISYLPKDDPVRRHFGMLHGISSLLLLGQLVVAGTVIAMDQKSS